MCTYAQYKNGISFHERPKKKKKYEREREVGVE